MYDQDYQRASAEEAAEDRRDEAPLSGTVMLEEELESAVGGGALPGGVTAD